MAGRENDDFFNRLEGETMWDLTGIVEDSDALLLSVDDDCRSLVKSFQEHCIALDLHRVKGQEQFVLLEQIAKLLEREFETLTDLEISTIVQTRGEGLCLTFDDSGMPDDILFISDETRLRGELLGVHCLPIPTDYALIAGISNDEREYAPTICLMLQGTNLEEYQDVVTQDNIIAIPLRTDTLGIDRVVAPIL